MGTLPWESLDSKTISTLVLIFGVDSIHSMSETERDNKITEVFHKYDDDGTFAIFGDLDPNSREIAKQNLQRLLKNPSWVPKFRGITDLKYITSQQNHIERIFFLFNFVVTWNLMANSTRSYALWIINV